jgi:hypothetical protein
MRKGKELLRKVLGYPDRIGELLLLLSSWSYGHHHLVSYKSIPMNQYGVYN